MTALKLGDRYINADRIVFVEFTPQRRLEAERSAVVGADGVWRTSPVVLARLRLAGFPRMMDIVDPEQIETLVAVLESSRLLTGC